MTAERASDSWKTAEEAGEEGQPWFASASLTQSRETPAQSQRP